MTGAESTQVRRGEAGFNLVEVVLALLVVAVGLISVFGLFPAGLDANQKAIGDTYSAVFAEEVFSGLRAEAGRRARKERLELASRGNLKNLDDKHLWSKLAEARLDLASYPAWVNGEEMVTEQTPDEGAGIYVNVYTNFSYRTHKAGKIVNHALRYRLEIDSDISGRPNAASALLYVWPGQFGPATADKARIYYSEFYKFDI